MSFLQTLYSVKNTVTETQVRSIIKTASYRLASSGVATISALLFGATARGAGAVGIFVLVFGIFTYYVNERIWLRTGWGRDAGVDSQKRTIVKTVLYRIFIFFVATTVGYVVITHEIFSAMYFALTQIPLTLITYYLIERFFNRIGWGKKSVAK
ncbi:Domain of unknown function DUF2061, membrane [uncultured Caudovirales phage]|uniref:DUF2061 domain-containing protein n=1 Tax=uncultured Caudovirales phage TaxID=2100421 RepID=A0A6J5L743_9CAUD|nr:Domain of unknown function DUF2061, membrane [uncultured Caudovirales phage]